ncbi:MAG TPA: hypothetical protein VK489_12295 [Ferruginibacter sp.]|nr:hypothetical protein [Ferruginibacter sp.]
MFNNTKTGTAGGTLLAILLSIDGQVVVNAAVNGAIGALASLGVTLAFNLVVKKFRK